MRNGKAGFMEKAYDNFSYNAYMAIATGENALAREAHFHSRFEMLYIIEGEIEAVVNGKSCIRKEGEIVVVNAFQPHYYLQKSKNIRAYVMTVDDLYLSDFYKIYGKKQFVFDPKKEAGDAGKRIAEYLHTWALLSGTYDVMANLGWFNLVLSELVKIYELREMNEVNLSSMEILQYIQEHYAENITMEKMAKKMGYTKEYFSGIFNRLVGMNFRSYLNKIRLEKAQILLKDKSRRVTDVIGEVGFANAVMYYRAVKKFAKASENDEKTV